MSTVVEFAGGSAVLVRGSDGDVGLEPVGAVDNAVRKVNATLTDALASVREVAQALRTQVDLLTRPPAEVVAEFGLELSASGQFVVVSTDVKATLKLTLTWKNSLTQA